MVANLMSVRFFILFCSFFNHFIIIIIFHFFSE
jgi:hypothetical protein